MLSEILVPDEQHHSIELPKELYGKKVQVIAYEIADTAVPSIEEIRKTAWPLK
jgi:protein-tyrosine phosphatase